MANDVKGETDLATKVSSGDVAELARSYSGFGLNGSIYRMVAQAVVLVGIFILPIFFLPWSSNILEINKQLLLVVVAGIGLITWFLDIVMSGKLNIRFGSLDKSILGLALASVVTTIFSISQFRSIFGVNLSLSDALISVIALTVFYFLTVNLFDESGAKVRTTLLVSLFIALLFGFLQMIAVYVLKLPIAMSRAFNTIGTLNALGFVAAVSLPLFLKSKLYIPKLGFINIARLGAAISLVILVILNWWVLWVVAVAGMLASIALDSLMIPGNAKFRISKFLMPMLVVLLAAFVMIVNLNITVVKKNFPIEVSPSYKLSTQVAFSVLKEKLITGYGPTNFSLGFDKYGAKSLTNTTFTEAKFFDAASQFIGALIHGGIVYLLALAFLLLSLAMMILRIRKFSAGGDRDRINEISGSVATLVALLVGMFFYPFNLTVQFLFYISVALVSLVLWGEHKKSWNIEDKPLLTLAASLGFICGLIISLAGIYFISIHYISDVKYARAAKATDDQQAIKGLVSAINWSAKDDRYYLLASQRTLDLLAKELGKKLDKNDTERGNRIQNYVASAIDLAKRATVAGPKESANWVNLGDIYQNLIGLVNGVDKFAEDAFLKASELRPGDPTFYNRIGSMYLAKADLSRRLAASSSGTNAANFKSDAQSAIMKAETYFKKSIEISSSYGLAIYNLGVVYDREGKLAEAIKQLEIVAPANTNEPGLMFELGLLYYRNGQKDKALQVLRQAVLLAPDFANARWYLALIYEERGETELAIEQLQNILKNNPDNQDVISKLDQLQKGEKEIPPKKVLDQKPL